MNLRYGISIGPKNEGDALLVENVSVVAALHLHLQTHNQILPHAVQIHRHNHLIRRNGLRSLFQRISIGGEPYRCPISSY